MFIQVPSSRPYAGANLKLTMKLLAMSNPDLDAEIQNEIASNPALELVEKWRCPTCKRLIRRTPCPFCLQAHSGETPFVYISPRSLRYSRADFEDDEHEDGPFAGYVASKTLADYVMEQVGPFLDFREHEIAEEILGRIDEKGFLSDSISEIAYHVRSTPSLVEKVLHLIQRADPVGVATRNFRECMNVQIEELEKENRAHPLAKLLLNQYLERLGRKDFAGLARELRTSEEEVRAAWNFICKSLTTIPANGYNLDQTNPARFHDPDVIIHYAPNAMPGTPRLQVEIMGAVRGWLRVRPEFKEAVNSIEDTRQREEWEEQVERANLFAKCITQRDNAMVMIVRAIVKYQEDFILHGNAHAIKLTRAQLAKELGLHESTISRTVSDKLVQLPDKRVVEMSQFFDRSLVERDAVNKIIRNEVTPLSDEQIAIQLQQQFQLTVARRTVAKYRTMLGILPANLRQKAQPVNQSVSHS